MIAFFALLPAAVTALSVITWLIVHGGANLNRWLFIILPAGICIYMLTTGSGSPASFFGFLKFLSLCLAAWIIAMIRFNGWASSDRALIFGFIILAVNIIEAVVLEILSWLFDVSDSLYGGSVWNIAAGLILIATQALPRFITLEHSPHRKLRYELGAGWVLGYSMWNFAFIFNVLSPEHMFNESIFFALVHLGTPLLIVAFARFDTALYMQMRTMSLGLIVAISLVWMPDPFLGPLPDWHSQQLAEILSMISFVVACLVAVASLMRRSADLKPTSLLQLLMPRRQS